MTDELELLTRARPAIGAPSAETRLAARRELDDTIGGSAGKRPARRRSLSWLGWLVPAFGVVVVIAVAAVFLSVHGRTPVPGGSGGRLELVFRAEPTPQVPHVGLVAMRRTVQGVRLHLDAVLPGAHVASAGNELFVHVPRGRTNPDQVAALVRESERLLFFYDWEANALTPTGHTVASLLQGHVRSAIQISDGAGAPGSGSMPLYQAVKLAAKQPAEPSEDNARDGPAYYIFGQPGSPACTTAARYYHVTPIVGAPCYLAGPENSIPALKGDLHSAGLSLTDGHVLNVKQGWVVVEASYPYDGRQPKPSDPTAQFFVLRDHVALFGNDITNPHQSTDQTGSPDVSFGFTPQGANKFQTLTAAIAKRGELDSGPGQKLFQHFTVALGTQLISVPYIDYTTDPDGIPGNNGADIQGGFTTITARNLAQQLRLEARPVHLQLIRSKP
jgi:SecD/SecF fusion protein